ncbi:hypothetical protein ACXIT7_23045, partial [Escherichia coli]
MILANDFLEYLLNTERDLAARVRDRYDMYLKSLPVPQLADGMKWSTKTGHRVRVFSSIDFPIRLVVT